MSCPTGRANSLEKKAKLSQNIQWRQFNHLGWRFS